MSKLAKAIDATLTGNVRATRDLNLRYTDIQAGVAPLDHLATRLLSKEMFLSVKLQKKVWVEDGHDIEIAMHDIKRAMIEEIFGEFRPMLIEIRGALYYEDTVRVRTLLAEMEQHMFRDGL